MMRRLLRWGGYLAIAIVGAVSCWLLAQWQFDRNEERAGEIALVEANYDAPAVPLSDLIGEDGQFSPGDVWRPVALRGEYLSDEQLLVRNRPHGGTSAFEVLVPFQDESGRILIINRGWVAPGEGALPDEIAAAPEGTVDVVARLKPTEVEPSSGRGAPEGQVPTIHVPSIADAVSPDETIPSAYGQVVTEHPAASTQLGEFPHPSEDPGPHLSYAIQWILFAIMGLVFLAYMVRTEVIAQREEREGRVVKAKEPKRRDRDADAEDELLDAV